MRSLVLFAVCGSLALLGARLLRLAQRTGASPERLLGAAFCVAGVSASLIPIAASSFSSAPVARFLVFAAQTGLSCAVALLARFTWVVFRPASPVARVAAPLLIAGNLATLPLLLADGAPTPTGANALAVLLPRIGVMAWTFVESAAHARAMRRRVRVGLADPLVANRFVLWTVWTGALVALPLFVLALRISGALVEPTHGEALPAAWRAVLAAVGAGLSVALLAVWLAFFPPASYQRWVAGSGAHPRSR